MVKVNDMLINEEEILWCFIDKQISFLGLGIISGEMQEKLKDVYTITIGFKGGEEKSFFNLTEETKDSFIDYVMRSCYENKHKQK